MNWFLPSLFLFYYLTCCLVLQVESRIIVISSIRSGSTYFTGFFNGACEYHKELCLENYKTWFDYIYLFMETGETRESNVTRMEAIIEDLRNSSNVVILLFRNPLERMVSEENLLTKSLSWVNQKNVSQVYNTSIRPDRASRFERYSNVKLKWFIRKFADFIDFYLDYDSLNNECLDFFSGMVGVPLNTTNQVYKVSPQSCSEKMRYLTDWEPNTTALTGPRASMYWSFPGDPQYEDYPSQSLEPLEGVQLRMQLCENAKLTFYNEMRNKHFQRCLYFDPAVKKANGTFKPSSGRR